MMKRITLTILGLLLMVGGVCSQTTLEFTGGTNRDLPSGDHLTSGIIQFRDNGIRSCLGGSAWAASYNSGETHTFTVTLEDSDNESCTLYLGAYSEDISSNWYGSYTPIAEQSISVPDTKTLTLTVSSSYHGVYLYASGYKKVNIRSITRTITTASSVAAPTISPATGSTYDGSIDVTIAKGANNTKVVYSVSGSNEDDSNVEFTSAELTAGSKILSLTGTGTITVTATGYVGEEASNPVISTYTYDSNIPSGVISVWTGNQSFGGNWSENLPIDKSYFSDIEEGDYVYIYATHDGAVTDIGFRSDRNGWDEAPWYGFTNANGYTSGGNGAHGSMAADETYWWLKVGKENSTIKANVYEGDHDTDIALDAPYYFKNYNTIIQGLNFTLTSVEIHKAKSISESSDNLITKYTDMIVNLDRSFVAGTWNTVCLPFVPTSAQANELFGSGYQLAEFTGVSNTTMHFTTINIAAFEAGKPYLVLPKTGCATGTTVLFDVNITAKTPQTVTYGDYSFVGTFTSKTFSGSECAVSRFVATENKLKTPKENSTMKALRAYFTVPSSSNNARSFTIDGVEDEATTTSINEEAIVKGATSPTMIYNLAGQRVSQPTKGLYIVNGKKIVMNK